MKTSRARLAAASAAAAFNLFAFGQAFALSDSSLPPMKTQGSVTYLTGGIGKDEADALRAAAPKYPLALEFVQNAKPKGEFLANVDVTIKDHAGKTVIDTVSDGPFLLAKLPPGRYTVVAEVRGQSRTLETTLASHRPRHLIVVW